MNFFKRLFRKEKPKEVPAMPPWAKIVEMMYDKNLTFDNEVVRVVYSADKTMRYVILRDEKGFFTYQLEALLPFYEDEWKYFHAFHSDKDALPAMWEPVTIRGIAWKSVFENEEQLLKELLEEPEYKHYFE
ncbi:MAG: hypothetical protein ACI3W5_10155 [Faecousia sp.]